MNETTVSTLSAITRRFYDASACGFAAGREMPWPGWITVLDRLRPVLADRGSISVLDVGCGNGRLATCLAAHLDRPFSYRGMDASRHLVDLARRRTAGLEQATCEVGDLVDGPLPKGQYTLVTAFGVLHHVPSFVRRRRLIDGLSRRVAAGGALVLSTWRVGSELVLRRKTVPWSQVRRRAGVDLDPSQVEAGDHVLAKPGDPLRYCHFVDACEEEALLRDLPLRRLATFDADGRERPLNRYFLLVRPRRPAARPPAGSERRLS